MNWVVEFMEVFIMAKPRLSPWKAIGFAEWSLFLLLLRECVALVFGDVTPPFNLGTIGKVLPSAITKE